MINNGKHDNPALQVSRGSGARIAICGGPKTGKSTLAARIAAETGCQLIATDAYMDVPWGQIPDVILPSLKATDSWVLEGVQAARVLRRWLNDGSPFALDRCYWLNVPYLPRTDGQESMAKGVATVFMGGVRAVLLSKNIPILTERDTERGGARHSVRP